MVSSDPTMHVFLRQVLHLVHRVNESVCERRNVTPQADSDARLIEAVIDLRPYLTLYCKATKCNKR